MQHLLLSPYIFHRNNQIRLFLSLRKFSSDVQVGKSWSFGPVLGHLPGGDSRAVQLRRAVHCRAPGHGQPGRVSGGGHARQLARKRHHLLARENRSVGMDRKMVQGETGNTGTPKTENRPVRHLARPPCLGACHWGCHHPRPRLLQNQTCGDHAPAPCGETAPLPRLEPPHRRTVGPHTISGRRVCEEWELPPLRTQNPSNIHVVDAGGEVLVAFAGNLLEAPRVEAVAVDDLALIDLASL